MSLAWEGFSQRNRRMGRKRFVKGRGLSGWGKSRREASVICTDVQVSTGEWQLHEILRVIARRALQIIAGKPAPTRCLRSHA